MKIICRCEQPIDIGDNSGGMSFNCPSCGTLLTVPTIAPSKPPVMVKPNPNNRNTHVCLNCESAMRPKTTNNFNIFIAFVLFLFFIIPCLIYIVWGMMAGAKCCSVCGSNNIVPITSLKALKILADKKGSDS
jgi:hypothetical protein